MPNSRKFEFPSGDYYYCRLLDRPVVGNRGGSSIGGKLSYWLNSGSNQTIGRMDSTTNLGGPQHWRVVILWRDFQARLEVRMSNQRTIWAGRRLLADKSSLFGSPKALLAI
jgi:hypothetical protein